MIAHFHPAEVLELRYGWMRMQADAHQRNLDLHARGEWPGIYPPQPSQASPDAAEHHRREHAIGNALAMTPGGTYYKLRQYKVFAPADMVAIASVTVQVDPELDEAFWLATLERWNETRAIQDACAHLKVYDGTCLTSHSPQYPWICSACGYKGRDQAELPRRAESYDDIVKRTSPS